MSKLLVDEISDADNTGPVTVTDGLTVQGAFTSLGIDDNATSTAITLDASGNLLVGTISNNIYGGTTTGINLNPDGATSFNRASGQAAMFNRISTDGDIVQFRKDGTTVGSIGILGGATYFSSVTHALMINGSTVEPANYIGTRVNNTMDIGSGTYRFKDLYLSGGVYLGGTVAANKLDDYEEGTWTVVNRSIASLTISNDGQARYVKIGGLVFIHFYITYPSTADTNQAKISLPFVCTGYGMLTGRLQNSAKSGTTGFVMTTLNSTDEAAFYPITSASNAYINSELNGSFLLLSGCYQTSA